MNDLQKFIFTTIATDTNGTIKRFYLNVHLLIPLTTTQVMFNESIMKYYAIKFDSWYTERKISSDGNELQVDIGSAQHINSRKYLIEAFQTEARIRTPNKKII